MKRYLKNILLIALVTLLSGCSTLNQNINTQNPKNIDDRLPVVNTSSIKTISDVNTIALEWKGYNDDNVLGYNIYRSDLQKDSNNLTRIAVLKNKYISHYVDTNLELKTTYLYSISTIGKNKTQSVISEPIQSSTLDTIDSVSFSIAVSHMPRQVKVLWRPHSNKAVSYYAIQRSNDEQSEWETIDKVYNRLSAEYIDTGLKDNYMYYYRIISITFNDIVSHPSAVITATTKPLPKSTSKITASDNLAKKIVLRWEPLNDDNIAGYKIYASNNARDNFKQVGTAKKDDNAFAHKLNENSLVQYYKVTSIDIDGLESDINKIQSAMGMTLPSPVSPQITLGLIKNQRVIINWKNIDNRAVSYNVYKTIKENVFQSKTKIFKSVNDTRFEDSDIVKGVEYKYEVQSVDEHGLLSDKTIPILLSMPIAKKVQ